MRALPLLLLAGTLLSGCAGPRTVPPAEFERQYANVGLAHTVKSYKYLGQREGRAYLQVGTMYPVVGWSEHVICVELAKLDPEFQDSLPRKEFEEPE